MGTPTLSCRIAKKSAVTRIHRSDESETCRKGQRHGGAGDRNLLIFERLPEDFQHVTFEFRQFIQKEHAMMSQADLARFGDRSSTNQSGVADRVMWRAKRAGSEKPACIRVSGNAVYFGCLQRFFKSDGRQDRRNSLGEHGLTRSRRAN